MTPVLFLGQAVLSLALFASSFGPGPLRDRIVRWCAWLGVGSGIALFIWRDGLEPWRGLELSSDDAAIVGIAVACTWGLVIALDLAADRWWAGALAGVAATGLIGFAGALWAVLVLLFMACGSAALSLAGSRAGRAGWLSMATADAAMGAVLVADLISRDEWAAPESIDSLLLIPLLVSCAVRVGLLVRLGPLGFVGHPAAVMAPLVLASGLVALSRWVSDPLPIAAAAVLLLAIGVAGWSILRRSIDPTVVGVWPVALGSALVMASEQATVPASLGALLGITVVCLWPDSMERGRLSRALVLSGLAPTVFFGAIGIAARESFVLATGGGDALEVAAWVAVSALLPVAFASGVAVGIYSARSEPVGGYHPEAVFMTWVLLAMAVVAGFALGAGEVYGALGGGPAAIVFGFAVVLGAAAALRVSARSSAAERAVGGVSCSVGLGRAPRLGTWAGGVAIVLLAATAGAIGWVTVLGLQQGFL